MARPASDFNMSNPGQPAVELEGADSDLASPTLDLIASAVLIVIAIAMMAASVALPIPGEIQTAPGLLPFIVAASLLVMALALGASALARRRAGDNMPAFAGRDLATDMRSLLLAVAVAIYIAALQMLAFQQNFSIFGVPLVLSAFEPTTIVAITAIIHMSWRGPLWIAATVSIVWTVILSLVFQLLFHIPLPGTF